MLVDKAVAASKLPRCCIPGCDADGPKTCVTWGRWLCYDGHIQAFARHPLSAVCGARGTEPTDEEWADFMKSVSPHSSQEPPKASGGTR